LTDTPSEIHDDVPFAFTKEQSAEAFIRPFDLGKAPLFRAGSF
jgi:fengycin family lipopeptide synthetase D